MSRLKGKRKGGVRGRGVDALTAKEPRDWKRILRRIDRIVANARVVEAGWGEGERRVIELKLPVKAVKF